jgi:sulfate permease, SulP family
VRRYRLYTQRLGRIYGHAARPDFIAVMAAMLGVLVFDTLPGLFIGIGVSLLLLLYRAPRPPRGRARTGARNHRTVRGRDRHPENETVEGVAVLRVESGLFFANAEAVRAAVRARAAQPGTRAVVFDAVTIAFVDVTAVGMLTELAEDLDGAGVRLPFAHDIGQVRDLLRLGDGVDGRVLVYPTVRAAVEALGT